MRAVNYRRVSDLSQVEGHSLDAQERAFNEYCEKRGWTSVADYCEAGRSAHVDTIEGRPVFRQLLDDSSKGLFDVVVVHTLDRWSRNLKVMLEAFAILGENGVGLVSITENIDYSTPHGRFTMQTLGSVNELSSGLLSVHTKKGISERALKGFHLGSIPFGYESCWESKGGERRLRCKPEHSGNIHVHHEEGPAVRELFKRYSTGMVTLAVLAGGLNEQGFRTRNTKKLADGSGSSVAGPRLFTSASVRHILHNAIYCGNVRHRNELLPGVHEALVSEEVFETVQDTMRRNSGRSRTLQHHPQREYLLKGLIQCAHCRMPMWAQTFVNGRRYYREQKGSRGAGYCVGRSGSMPCEVPDEQIGNIVSAIVLPDAWVDRVLAQVQLADEVKQTEMEKEQIRQRLRRLGQIYFDGLVTLEDYKRQKQLLEEKLRSLVVPEADAAVHAGQILQDLPEMWGRADLSERRRILMTMLSAVYVDTVEEKRIVAIRPKPAFRALFEIATTRKDSGVVLISEDQDQKGQPPEIPSIPAPGGQGVDGSLCFWWRRGRVELYREHGNSVLVAA